MMCCNFLKKSLDKRIPISGSTLDKGKMVAGHAEQHSVMVPQQLLVDLEDYQEPTDVHP